MEFAFDGTHTEEAWREWYGTNFDVDDGGVVLETDPAPAYLPSEPAIEDPPADFAAIDLDLDGCEDLYLLASAGDPPEYGLYHYDRVQGTLDRLPCLQHDGVPGALCATAGTLYVAYGAEDDESGEGGDETGADGAGGRLHAVSRHLLQTRWIADEPFEDPIGVVGDEAGLYVLDAGTESDGFVVHVGADGSSRTAVTGIAGPTDVAMDDAGTLYVLDVTRPDDGPEVAAIRRFTSDDLAAPRRATSADDIWIGELPFASPACIESVDDGTVIVGVDPEEDAIGERTPFRYRPEDGTFERLSNVAGGFVALRSGRGRVRGRRAGLYGVDADARGVRFAEETERNRLNGATGRYDARLFTRFDSGTTGTQWHRVTLDLDVEAAGTQVRLRYHATDRYGLDLEEVVGIGPAYAERLREAGVSSLWELLGREPDAIAGIVNLSPDRLDGWLDQATELIEADELEEVEGIGPVYAGRLREAGVPDLSALLGLDADAIAEITDASPRRTEEWLDRAGELIEADELEEVEGIGPAYAERLREAGVSDLSALLGLDADAIAGIVNLSPDRLDGWLDQAEGILDEWLEGVDAPLGTPNPGDALLDSAEGRYLWVTVELLGNESASPRVGSLRAYFPRQSYLRHLPAIYQEDEESREFLQRFLSIFESTFVDVEEEIEAITRYFDPHGIPPDYLSWLGRWLALDTDETWSAAAKRELVSRAPELFKKRGTREGILSILRIYLDGGEDPPASWTAALDREVAEIEAMADEGHMTTEAATAAIERRERSLHLLTYDDLDCTRGAVREEYTRIVSRPECFLVLVRPPVDDERMRTIQRLVESETPAHAVGRAVELQPWTRLGGNSYLGVNTALPERDFVLDRSGLGEDSVLVEREEYAQLELRSRLDRDSTVS